MALLEVCCGDIRSVKNAAVGGADRIELCSSLETGGVTPSAGLIREAVRIFPGPVNVLIRPRSGDFLYTPEEVDVMIEDVKMAVALGASGIVIGALTTDGSVDKATVKRLISVAGGLPVTFHRAFDMCADSEQAMRDIIESGCSRVLTSGQKASAMEGSDSLRRMVVKSEGRIIILAGGGGSSENVVELIGRTGVDEVHASAKRMLPSDMRFRRGGVSMGKKDADEYQFPCTDSSEVRLIKERLERI
ncbi:MAG: copper homeostasis protein CutC [Muribaculaceae bacterium]|nr:copper homeostasis protein CutC [Muribaculaceae bacterium]